MPHRESRRHVPSRQAHNTDCSASHPPPPLREICPGRSRETSREKSKENPRKIEGKIEGKIQENAAGIARRSGAVALLSPGLARRFPFSAPLWTRGGVSFRFRGRAN